MKIALGALILLTMYSVARSEPMRFFTAANGGSCHECEWTAADGDITPNTPTAFRKLVKDGSLRLHLHINSQGGDLAAGVELGRLFRENHLSVEVSKTVKNPDPAFKGLYDGEEGACVSACAYAFLGGEFRDANDGQIGIHQFSASLTNSGKGEVVVKRENGIETTTTLRTVQEAAAYLIQYVNSMGVDARFVALASSTEKVYFLKKSDLDLYKVRWQPREFAPWQIAPWGTGLIASSKTRDQQVNAFVYCYADKRPHFQITALLPNHDLGGALEFAHFYIFGQEIEGPSVDVKQINGSKVLDFKLKPFDPKTIKDLDDIFAWDVTNSVSDYFAYQKLPLAGAQENIAAALKNCAS